MTSATPAAWTVSGAANSFATTGCFCRWVTTSTGRPDQRRHVEAARDAGVHLGFFSGNEVFWKTRWEPGIDDSAQPHRTLVTYKETHDNAKIDPLPDVWTGTWRDSRAFNPEGSQPENALTGTIFTVNAWRNDPLIVPAEYARLRFWRNTEVAKLAPGQRAVLLKGLLGHEWDEDLDNGFRPPGLLRLSETTIDNVPYVQDCGSVFDSGTATHHLTLVSPRERRARLRGRYRAVGLGARRAPRHRDRRTAGAGECELDPRRR